MSTATYVILRVCRQALTSAMPYTRGPERCEELLQLDAMAAVPGVVMATVHITVGYKGQPRVRVRLVLLCMLVRMYARGYVSISAVNVDSRSL